MLFIAKMDFFSIFLSLARIGKQGSIFFAHLTAVPAVHLTSHKPGTGELFSFPVLGFFRVLMDGSLFPINKRYNVEDNEYGTALFSSQMLLFKWKQILFPPTMQFKIGSQNAISLVHITNEAVR